MDTARSDYLQLDKEQGRRKEKLEKKSRKYGRRDIGRGYPEQIYKRENTIGVKKQREHGIDFDLEKTKKNKGGRRP